MTNIVEIQFLNINCHIGLSFSFATEKFILMYKS